MTRLRNCSAEVLSPRDVGMAAYYLGTTKHNVNEDMSVLKSYDSIVAMIDRNTLILFPRYDYSVTTMMHVRKFVEDCTNVKYMTIARMRDCLKTGNDYQGIDVFDDAQFCDAFGKMRTH